MSESLSEDLRIAGQAPPIVEVTIVALFDRQSGRIAHLHTTFRHEGSGALDDDAVSLTARNHASSLGHDVSTLASAISHSLQHLGRPHRINPETGQFEEIATKSAPKPTE